MSNPDEFSSLSHIEGAGNLALRLFNHALHSGPLLLESLIPNIFSASSNSETTPLSRSNEYFSSSLGPLCCSIIEPLLSGAVRKSPLPPFTMNRSSALHMSSEIDPSNRFAVPTPAAMETAIRHDHRSDSDEIDELADLKDPCLVHPEISCSLHPGESTSHAATRASSIPVKPAVTSKGENLYVDRNVSPKPLNLDRNIPSSPGWSWRGISPSPGPLGLIPVHCRWSVFVHQNEVPRKLLHVSIGLLTIYLYISGTQTTAITPWLIGALIPIAAMDYLRHHYDPVNKFYVRVLGILMRESEYKGWNGVMWYLLGVWVVLAAFPKDIGLMGILLLSWCDTAASTLGRAYGRYTPSIRKGKSLAGSTAAFVVGVATAATFWGWLAPRSGPFPGDENFPFMFTGILHLPSLLRDLLGLTAAQSSVGEYLALGIMSVYTGVIASLSEAVDLFGWDDNLTIPVLSGIGLWGFLKVFG